MSETRFTKGPWRWSSEFTNDAHDPTYSLLGDGSYGILSCDVPNAPQSCNKHDVYLIAAAPDLYDALSRIMHYASMGAAACDVDTTEQPEFVRARAALAKARGENEEVKA